MQLEHIADQAIEVRHEGALLFRYVYAPQVAPQESPKPYFHPLQTLAGEVVTAWRPHDHLWHSGLSMTCAELSGQNFWGGPTFVRDADYQWLDNVGHQQHQSWDETRCDESGLSLCERLHWITQADEIWIDETRRIAVNEVDTQNGVWSLDLEFRLRNTRGKELVWGSPTTQGRPNAGYGGLFWRGPRSFQDGQILGAEGLQGPEVMGQSAPWLAYVGKHDETARTSTLVFLDRSGNVRYPNPWFVRATPYACASASFMFGEEYVQAPGEELVLNYRVIVADGEWKRERIEDSTWLR